MALVVKKGKKSSLSDCFTKIICNFVPINNNCFMSKENDYIDSNPWDDSVVIDKDDYCERLREGIGSNFHIDHIDDEVYEKAIKEAVDETVDEYTDEDDQTFIDDWDYFENEMYWLAVKKLHLDED